MNYMSTIKILIVEDELITAEAIKDLLEGINYEITTRTVDNFILKLRQKIESDPNHPKIILTVHGIGYKMLI